MKMFFKSRSALRSFKGNGKKIDLKNSVPEVKPSKRWALEVSVGNKK